MGAYAAWNWLPSHILDAFGRGGKATSARAEVAGRPGRGLRQGANLLSFRVERGGEVDSEELIVRRVVRSDDVIRSVRVRARAGGNAVVTVTPSVLRTVFDVRLNRTDVSELFRRREPLPGPCASALAKV